MITSLRNENRGRGMEKYYAERQKGGVKKGEKEGVKREMRAERRGTIDVEKRKRAQQLVRAIAVRRDSHDA